MEDGEDATVLVVDDDLDVTKVRWSRFVVQSL